MTYRDLFAQSSAVGAQRQGSIVQAVDSLDQDNLKGDWMNVSGVNGVVNIEIIKEGAGTCDYKVQGTFDLAPAASDSSNIADVRYAALGSPGALVPVAGDTAMSAGEQKVWITILDKWPTIRILLDTGAGNFTVATRYYLVPQS